MCWLAKSEISSKLCGNVHQLQVINFPLRSNSDKQPLLHHSVPAATQIHEKCMCKRLMLVWPGQNYLQEQTKLHKADSSPARKAKDTCLPKQLSWQKINREVSHHHANSYKFCGKLVFVLLRSCIVSKSLTRFFPLIFI